MATAAAVVVTEEEALPLAVELPAGASHDSFRIRNVHILTIIVCSSGIKVGANAFI
jgi:hypothetical protein